MATTLDPSSGQAENESREEEGKVEALGREISNNATEDSGYTPEHLMDEHGMPGLFEENHFEHLDWQSFFEGDTSLDEAVSGMRREMMPSPGRLIEHDVANDVQVVKAYLEMSADEEELANEVKNSFRAETSNFVDLDPREEQVIESEIRQINESLEEGRNPEPALREVESMVGKGHEGEQEERFEELETALSSENPDEVIYEQESRYENTDQVFRDILEMDDEELGDGASKIKNGASRALCLMEAAYGFEDIVEGEYDGETIEYDTVTESVTHMDDENYVIVDGENAEALDRFDIEVEGNEAAQFIGATSAKNWGQYGTERLIVERGVTEEGRVYLELRNEEATCNEQKVFDYNPDEKGGLGLGVSKFIADELGYELERIDSPEDEKPFGIRLEMDVAGDSQHQVQDYVEQETEAAYANAV